MTRRGYLPDGRRTLTHRSLVRHLRRVLRASDEHEAQRYASELAGYLGRPAARHALDALETFRAAVKTLAALAALALVVALASPASAASAQDEATAETLFRDGKQLVAAGRYAEACPKFVESQRLSPSTGTLLNVGDCYEHLGKLASAWGAFQDARNRARSSGDTDREKEAERRADILKPKLAMLEIVVPGATRAIPGLTIKKEGAPVGEGQWGSPLPTDVGNYTIEASAPGHKTWSSSIRIAADGSSASVWVPALEKGDAQPFWTGQRAAGIAVGSVGVVGVIVGSALGGLAVSKNSASKQDCSPADPNSCTPAGVALRQVAITTGNASTAAIVVGSALVTTGIVLFATGAPSKKTELTKTEGARVEVLPGVGALALRGRF
jgi:hypothetical protein